MKGTSVTIIETAFPDEQAVALFEAGLREMPQGRAEALAVVGVETEPLPPRRLRRAKKAYTTRFFARQTRDRASEGYSIVRGDGVVPQPGDLVLARVRVIGQHKRIESYNSRRRHLFAGDEIVVAYGNRYAADQFLAMVPGDLGPAHHAAAGGLASRVLE